MKQCSCGKDAWEGSQEIKEPTVKEEHLALDSQLVGVGSSRHSTTADKYQVRFSIHMSPHSLRVCPCIVCGRCACKAVNITKVGMVSGEDGLTLTSQGARESLMDQNVERTQP